VNYEPAVRAHALAHYNADGWDYVIETMTEAELAEVIGGVRSERAAIAKVRRLVKLWKEVWG